MDISRLHLPVMLLPQDGGEGGIRTPDGYHPMSVFKTDAINQTLPPLLIVINQPRFIAVDVTLIHVPCPILIGSGRRIRTFETKRCQIYSLMRLTASLPHCKLKWSPRRCSKPVLRITNPVHHHLCFKG